MDAGKGVIKKRGIDQGMGDAQGVLPWGLGYFEEAAVREGPAPDGEALVAQRSVRLITPHDDGSSSWSSRGISPSDYPPRFPVA